VLNTPLLVVMIALGRLLVPDEKQIIASGSRRPVGLGVVSCLTSDTRKVSISTMGTRLALGPSIARSMPLSTMMRAGSLLSRA
jgi:hypothetical protein